MKKEKNVFKKIAKATLFYPLAIGVIAWEEILYSPTKKIAEKYNQTGIKGFIRPTPTLL